MTAWIAGLQRFLAIAILACFFLPLCQCTSRPAAPASGDAASASASASAPGPVAGATHAPTVVVYVPAAIVTTGGLGYAPVVFGFAWPLLAVAIARRVRARGPVAAMALDGAEIALAAVTAYYAVQLIRLYGEIRVGGVLLLASLAAYLACSMLALRGDVLAARAQRQRSPRPRT